MFTFFFDLQAMTELNMCIQTSHNLVKIGDQPFPYESQPRRFSCHLVVSFKMQKFLAKVARNKRTKSGLFRVSLHFAEELEYIKTGFGSKLDTQLEELIAKFADITRKTQG